MVFLSSISPVGSSPRLGGYGMSNTSSLSTLDGVRDGLLPSSLPEFLVRNALWPSHAWNLTETGVDEDLQFVV